MEQTLVIGATTKEDRYANRAIRALRSHKYPVVAFGQKAGTVLDVDIETEWNPGWDIETVTLYLGPQNQKEYIDKIIALKPNRVIFNPGTENEELEELALCGRPARERSIAISPWP